jgi:hypothetical protein
MPRRNLMPTDDKQPLRQELEDAIANVRRQIEIQETSSGAIVPGMGPREGETALADLRVELAELEGALADLGPSGS